MRASVLAALALLWAGPAAAHPHVWIDASLELDAKQGALVGIRHNWRFDEQFSEFLIGEFDTDGDGRFSAEETARIADEAFGMLQEYDYFTDLRAGGRRVPTKTATGLAIDIDPAKRVVTYHFETPPPEPVPLLGNSVTLALYDDSFYVDIGLIEQDPVRFAGIAGCTYGVAEDPDIDLMGGLFHPQAIWITCAAS